MSRSLFYRVGFVLVAVLVLAACAGTQGKNAAVSPSPALPTVALTTASPTPSPTAAASPAPAVTAVDALGRKVSLAKPPQRIVLAGKASLLLADAVYAFPDAPKRVVGLVKGKQSLGFLALVDPDVAKKAVLARDAGPEQIAALHPDLVILKSFLYPKLGKALESLGIPVFTMQLEVPEHYPKELAQLGKILGEENRGKALADYYSQKMQMMQEKLQGEGYRPRALVLRVTARGGKTAYAVPPRGWIQSGMVSLAGGEPVWSDVQGSGWTPVTIEQVAAWKPEVIFVVSYQKPPAEAAAEFADSSTAKELQAVRDQRVFPIPRDFLSWDQPDTRWILGAEWMAKQMHPDVFSKLNLRSEVSAFYRSLYGLNDSSLKAIWAKLGW